MNATTAPVRKSFSWSGNRARLSARNIPRANRKFCAFRVRTFGFEAQEASQVHAARQRGVGGRELLVRVHAVVARCALQLRDRHGVVHVDLLYPKNGGIFRGCDRTNSPRKSTFVLSVGGNFWVGCAPATRPGSRGGGTPQGRRWRARPHPPGCEPAHSQPFMSNNYYIDEASQKNGPGTQGWEPSIDHL